MILCLNGQYLDGKAACLPVTERGFTLGDGVFDSMLVLNGAPVFADLHYARLCRHATVMGLSLPISREAFYEQINTLIAKNNADTGRFSLRTTLTRGTELKGLAPRETAEPTILQTLSPAPPLAGNPLRVWIAQTVRRNEYSPLSRIKSLNYGDNILAAREAKAHGCDDALLMNTAGALACGTIGNLFFETEDGQLVTPPLCAGILDGTMRQTLIEKMDAIETPLFPEALQMARGVYLCNSIRGIAPVETVKTDTKDSHYTYENSLFWPDLKALNQALAA